MLNDFNCADYNMVQSLCRVLESLLTNDNVPKNMPNEAVVIESYFVFAAVWAFGSGFTITDTGTLSLKRYRSVHHGATYFHEHGHLIVNLTSTHFDRDRAQS